MYKHLLDYNDASRIAQMSESWVALDVAPGIELVTSRSLRQSSELSVPSSQEDRGHCLSLLGSPFLFVF